MNSALNYADVLELWAADFKQRAETFRPQISVWEAYTEMERACLAGATALRRVAELEEKLRLRTARPHDVKEFYFPNETTQETES